MSRAILLTISCIAGNTSSCYTAEQRSIDETYLRPLQHTTTHDKVILRRLKETTLPAKASESGITMLDKKNIVYVKSSPKKLLLQKTGIELLQESKKG